MKPSKDPETRKRLSALRSAQRKAEWADPVKRAEKLRQFAAAKDKRSAKLKVIMSNPAYRARQSEAQKKAWAKNPQRRRQEPETVKTTLRLKASELPKVHDSLEQLIFGTKAKTKGQKISEANRRRWADPTYRTQQTALNRAMSVNPNVLAARSKTMKQRWSEQGMRQQWLDAQQAVKKQRVEKLRRTLCAPAARSAFSERMRLYWSNPNNRMRQSETLLSVWEKKRIGDALVKPN